jgi:hypothetical protein
MLLAFVISGAVTLIMNQKIILGLITGILVYCFITVSYQLKAVDTYLEKNLEKSIRSHSIYYSYYLAHFRPLQVVKRFEELHAGDSPFVVIRDAEPYDLPEYLEKYHIPVQDFSLLDSALMAGKKVFLFSRYPNEIESIDFCRHHGCSVKMISEGISYHNLFELEHVNLPGANRTE